jgi:hypothetical protein
MGTVTFGSASRRRGTTSETLSAIRVVYEMIEEFIESVERLNEQMSG